MCRRVYNPEKVVLIGNQTILNKNITICQYIYSQYHYKYIHTYIYTYIRSYDSNTTEVVR
jgi:hypothetical protein